MKNINIPFQLACEKIQDMLDRMGRDQKIRGEIYRCTSFQGVIDVFSKNRGEMTVILSDEINEDENLLAQVKEIINEKKEITVAVLSFAPS